jgi:hypothetical protein
MCIGGHKPVSYPVFGKKTSRYAPEGRGLDFQYHHFYFSVRFSLKTQKFYIVYRVIRTSNL